MHSIIALFHKYCCFIKRGGITLQLIWLWEIIGGMLLMCQNATMRVYGARIKIYCILCSKTYSSSRSLVIISRWFATSRLGAPASVRQVYCFDKSSSRTATGGWIWLCAPLSHFHIIWLGNERYHSWHDAFSPNVILGAKWNLVCYIRAKLYYVA